MTFDLCIKCITSLCMKIVIILFVDIDGIFKSVIFTKMNNKNDYIFQYSFRRTIVNFSNL